MGVISVAREISEPGLTTVPAGPLSLDHRKRPLFTLSYEQTSTAPSKWAPSMRRLCTRNLAHGFGC